MIALAGLAVLVAALVAVVTGVTGGSDDGTPGPPANLSGTVEKRASKPLVRTGPPKASPARAERCFGAAAHDPAHPCVNPKLRLAVVPTPDEARTEPNALCVPVGQQPDLLPCEFGVAERDAKRTFALVGDSHASHWRAALARVAQAKGWRGVTLSRSGCPFSAATAILPGASASAECVRWNHAALAWLRDHPQVTTVFLSSHSGGDVLTAPGRTPVETQVAGYAQRWSALPPTITRIFVIRDTPRNSSRAAACVRRALRRHQPAGVVCAVPRSFAVRDDPEATAARRLASPRVHLIDLTRFMCSDRLCPPVIGGALVHKDNDHLTQTFSATLAPYFLKRIADVG